MRVEFLWEESCGICTLFRDNDVLGRLRGTFNGLRFVTFVDGMAEQVVEPNLHIDNGRIKRKSGVLKGPIFEDMANRRPEGYENMATPMMHLVSRDDYAEVYPGDLVGGDESTRELKENLTERPEWCTRTVMRRVYRYYTNHCIPADSRDVRRFRENEIPEQEPGEYKILEWQDAFINAEQLKF